MDFYKLEVSHFQYSKVEEQKTRKKEDLREYLEEDLEEDLKEDLKEDLGEYLEDLGDLEDLEEDLVKNVHVMVRRIINHQKDSVIVPIVLQSILL
mgnify:CR=1 FL=1|tara:strand:- start:405 stop:689 length:285 start_codon:yes stop_codon:yes gene_type:complete